MGITIAESISILKNKGKYSLTEKENEAKRVAIETMRKYQKIEQAYSAYLETMNPDTLADLISTII